VKICRSTPSSLAPCPRRLECCSKCGAPVAAPHETHHARCPPAHCRSWECEWACLARPRVIKRRLGAAAQRKNVLHCLCLPLASWGQVVGAPTRGATLWWPHWGGRCRPLPGHASPPLWRGCQGSPDSSPACGLPIRIRFLGAAVGKTSANCGGMVQFGIFHPKVCG